MTLKNEYERGSKGFLYYAHNNNEVNYLRLAICSATTGKYQIPTFRATVVTDLNSMEWLTEQETALLFELFEEVKINDNFQSDNKRLVLSDDSREISPWYNGTRPSAYYDSIYDETILIDVDFLFQDTNLDKLWGSNSPIMMNKDIIPIINEEEGIKVGFLPSEMVGTFTIPMYWATVVYFNRSPISEEFFDLINHIKDNYFYYQRLYQVVDGSYRNDYSFSIALYMINGYVTPGREWEIPYKFVLSRQCDSVYRVDKGQIKMITKHTGSIQAFNVQKTSLHCMNKISLILKYEELIEAYNDE